MARECKHKKILIYEKRLAIFMKRQKYFVQGVKQLRTMVGKEMKRMSCVHETLECRG